MDGKVNITVKDIMDIVENAMKDLPKIDAAFDKTNYELCEGLRKSLATMPLQRTQLSARMSTRMRKKCTPSVKSVVCQTPEERAFMLDQLPKMPDVPFTERPIRTCVSKKTANGEYTHELPIAPDEQVDAPPHRERVSRKGKAPVVETINLAPYVSPDTVFLMKKKDKLGYAIEFEDGFMLLSTMINSLNIRIVGSYEKPWFYAEDVAKALGVTKLQRLDDDVKVTDEKKKARGITTRRIRNNKFINSSNAVLITEHGLLTYLYKSRNERAKMIAKNLSRILIAIRIGQNRSLNVMPFEQVEEMQKENKSLKKVNKSYKKNVSTLHIFRKDNINENAYDHVPPADLKESYNTPPNKYCKTLFMVAKNIPKKRPSKFVKFCTIYGDNNDDVFNSFDDIDADALDISDKLTGKVLYITSYEEPNYDDYRIDYAPGYDAAGPF